MEAHFEAHRQLFLQWICSGEASAPDEMMLLFGLSIFGATLTPAREDEFVNALSQATANRAEATRLVLDYACRMGSMRLVQLLMPTNDVDCLDLSHTKPLTEAVDGGHVDVVRYLIARASTGLSGHVVLSMINRAVVQGHVEMVEYLLQLASEHFDVNVHVRFDNSSHEQVWTCGSLLERAFRWDQVEVASVLLSHGASGLHDTPEIVRWVSSVEMAELLYAHGADFCGDVGLQAAIASIPRGNNALFHFLLDHGADIRRAQYSSTPPFHAALSWGHNLLASDRDDITACRVAFLVDLFACAIDIDARHDDGSTALQCIASWKSMRDQERLVKVLVDLGASTHGCKGLELST